MSKHTLFLVHGMGRHEGSAWSDEVWDKLVECSRRYRFFQANELADWAEPVPIGYDQFIRTALQRWSDQAVSFGEFAGSNELRFADSLDWLAGVAGDDAGFLLSHVADVVIYRFFRLEQARIQDAVKAQIAAEVQRKLDVDGAAEFSVLAHSLGTAVAHDALAELGGSEHLDGVANRLWARNFHFRSIHMLANVSRVLQTKHKAYESVVRPGDRDSATSYCLRMYCHRHELDPITLVKPFEPSGWGDRFRLESLRHYRGWNVHGWLHYLDHPNVHIPILRSIARSTAIGRRETGRALDAYPRFGGDLEHVEVARTKLAGLHGLAQSLDEDAGLAENFDTLRELWMGIGELRDLVGATWAQLEGGVS